MFKSYGALISIPTLRHLGPSVLRYCRRNARRRWPSRFLPLVRCLLAPTQPTLPTLKVGWIWGPTRASLISKRYAGVATKAK